MQFSEPPGAVTLQQVCGAIQCMNAAVYTLCDTIYICFLCHVCVPSTARYMATHTFYHYHTYLINLKPVFKELNPNLPRVGVKRCGKRGREGRENRTEWDQGPLTC